MVRSALLTQTHRLAKRITGSCSIDLGGTIRVLIPIPSPAASNSSGSKAIEHRTSPYQHRLRQDSESLSEKGARLCRRPAAARREHSKTPKFWDLLRLVEDDTAALRGFQTASDKVSFPNCGKSFAARVEGAQPQASAAGRSASQFSGPAFFPIFRLFFALLCPESRLVYWRAKTARWQRQRTDDNTQRKKTVKTNSA